MENIYDKFFDCDSDISIDSMPDENFMVKLPLEYRIKLENEWNAWLKNNQYDISNIEITDEQLREQLMKELEFLSKMPAEEYTLYRKWCEIKEQYPTTQTFNKFFGENVDLNIHGDLKNNIWIPQDLDDYKKLRPKLICTNNNSDLTSKWNNLRVFIHTQINNSNIGRNLYFIVIDEITNKYLGLINISSDYLDLTPRDKYIGWSKEIKTQGRMINHTCVGSTICPTQPLGYNYVGGKLMALLCLSTDVELEWKNKYKDILVGVSTTSLYSSFSQYQNLSYWTKRGHSSGSIKFEPSRMAVESVKRWIMKNYTRKYWEWYVATEPGGMPLKRDFKQRSLSFVYSKLGIEKQYYEAHHEKGIYFSPLYTNTNEFLRKEITEDKLERRFDNSIDSLVNIWKEKYASKRLKSLVEQNKLNPNTLFYNDIINMSWSETKAKYLKDIGKNKQLMEIK